MIVSIHIPGAEAGQVLAVDVEARGMYSELRTAGRGKETKVVLEIELPAGVNIADVVSQVHDLNVCSMIAWSRERNVR